MKSKAPAPFVKRTNPFHRAIVLVDDLPVAIFYSNTLEGLAALIAKRDYPVKPRVKLSRSFHALHAEIERDIRQLVEASA